MTLIFSLVIQLFSSTLWMTCMFNQFPCVCVDLNCVTLLGADVPLVQQMWFANCHDALCTFPLPEQAPWNQRYNALKKETQISLSEITH